MTSAEPHLAAALWHHDVMAERELDVWRALTRDYRETLARRWVDDAATRITLPGDHGELASRFAALDCEDASWPIFVELMCVQFKRCFPPAPARGWDWLPQPPVAPRVKLVLFVNEAALPAGDGPVVAPAVRVYLEREAGAWRVASVNEPPPELA